jgi:L-cysteine S-thiosulfotransferase
MKRALLLLLLTACATAQDTRRSGREDMSAATRAMQADDSQNPAFLWVQQGQALFAAQCARCHSAASLRDKVLSYPTWDPDQRRPITLQARIRQCRVTHVQRPAWPPEHEEAVAVETFLAHQSRGQPVPVVRDARLRPAVQSGQRLWQQRMGQLDLSCAQCHDQSAGQRLAGSTIPQGHPTGYPIYRLEWQGMGSLERRIRGCMNGVRAEPFAYGSEELAALALYMKQRAAGMPIETPAVRP